MKTKPQGQSPQKGFWSFWENISKIKQIKGNLKKTSQKMKQAGAELSQA